MKNYKFKDNENLSPVIVSKSIGLLQKNGKSTVTELVNDPRSETPFTWK